LNWNETTLTSSKVASACKFHGSARQPHESQTIDQSTTRGR
jgi:hypothetical protein